MILRYAFTNAGMQNGASVAGLSLIAELPEPDKAPAGGGGDMGGIGGGMY